MKKLFLSFAAIIITNAVVAQIPADSLKLNYPFNNNSLDVSGNNLHGINNGAIITQDRFNNQNSAYQFNGSSAYIEVPNALSIKPDFPFTVSVWFEINEFSTTNFRLYSSDLTTNSYSGFWLSCGNDGRLSAGYGNGLNGLSSSNRVTKKMLYQVSEDMWYNYTVVFNGLNDIDLYLGCNEEVGTYSGGSSSMVNNGSLGQVGRGHTTTSYFNGIIDDIRIYNKSLDSLEIDSLCNESNPLLGCETYDTISVSGCHSYTVPSGDETYTSSGMFSDTIQNIAGCDSLITINLTINYPNASIDSISTCNSYTWIDGITYTTSNNSATDTLTNISGCDSIITLNLTIEYSATGTDTRTECDSLEWIDGITYYANNNTATYNIIGGAVNSCDSLVTLDLIINTVSGSVTQLGEQLTADESNATYQWLKCPEMTPIIGDTNQTYTATENGNYAVMITKNGCSTTSECHTFYGLSIIENSFKNRLIVHPNPSNGKFSIDLRENYDFVAITITDLNGKIVLTKSYEKAQILNLSLDDPAGIYLLGIESQDRKALIKLIKE